MVPVPQHRMGSLARNLDGTQSEKLPTAGVSENPPGNFSGEGSLTFPKSNGGNYGLFSQLCCASVTTVFESLQNGNSQRTSSNYGNIYFYF